MDQNSKEKTLENLTKAESILIAVSDSVGIDGLAAGLALHLSFQKLGKNVSILAKLPSVSDAMRLYGVDKIGKLTGKANMVVVVENAVDNVDKVTYFLEGNRLKILIHSLPGSKGVSEDQIKFEQLISKPDIIISIGFPSMEDMKKMITQEQNIDSNVWIVSINKHELSQKYAQANVFSSDSESISEITTQFVQELALPVDEDIAYNLFEGISQATGNFSLSKSSPVSFQMASWLIKFGAGRASLAGAYRRTSTVDESKQESQSVGRLFSPTEYVQTDPAVPSQRIGIPSSFDSTPIENVEPEKLSEKDWLKPPKIYKGSKSFDREN